MKLHKNTIQWTLALCIVSLTLAIVLTCCHIQSSDTLTITILVGAFSSGLVTLFSAIIGYYRSRYENIQRFTAHMHQQYMLMLHTKLLLPNIFTRTSTEALFNHYSLCFHNAQSEVLPVTQDLAFIGNDRIRKQVSRVIDKYTTLYVSYNKDFLVLQDQLFPIPPEPMLSDEELHTFFSHYPFFVTTEAFMTAFFEWQKELLLLNDVM